MWLASRLGGRQWALCPAASAPLQSVPHCGDLSLIPAPQGLTHSNLPSQVVPSKDEVRSSKAPMPSPLGPGVAGLVTEQSLGTWPWGGEGGVPGVQSQGSVTGLLPLRS